MKGVGESLVSGIDLLDLELMNHWTAETSDTLTEDGTSRLFWRQNAVKIGLRSNFVMLSILSLAAQHLAYQDPSRRSRLVERSILYHSIASKRATELMAEDNATADQQKTEDLLLFSMLALYLGRCCNPKGVWNLPSPVNF